MKKNTQKIILAFITLFVLFSPIQVSLDQSHSKVETTTVQAVEVTAGEATPPVEEPDLTDRLKSKAVDPIILGFTSSIVTGLIKFLNVGMYIIYAFASLITFAGGALMNLSIHISIVNFANLLSNTSSLGQMISGLWVIFRDLANTVFIFALLWGSLQIILGMGGTNVKKLITNVVIAAVIVNFSLFATRVAIDFSNTITIAIYNETLALNVSAIGGSESKKDVPLDAQAVDMVANVFQSIGGGLSGKYMEATNVLKTTRPLPLGEQTTSAQTTAQIFNAMNLPGRLLFNSIMLILAASIMFAVALVFMYRFAVIIFLMILSPIAFIGMVLPQLKSKLTDVWLKELINNIFFPPLFFLLVYISLNVIGALNVTSALAENLKDPAGGSTLGTLAIEQITILFSLVISGIFLTIPLFAAKTFSAKGSGVVEKMFGATRGYMAAKTVGKAASTFEDSVKDSKFFNGTKMRALRGATTQKLVNQKFGGIVSSKEIDDAKSKTKQIQSDIESRLALKENLRKLSDDTTSDADKDDARRIVKAEIAKMNSAQLLELGDKALEDNATLLSDKQVDDLEKSDLGQQKRAVFNNIVSKRTENVRVAMKALSTGAVTEDAGRKELTKAMKSFSPKTLATMNKEDLNDENVAGLMPQAAFEEIMKSSSLSDIDKDEIKRNRDNFFIKNPAEVLNLDDATIIKLSQKVKTDPNVIKLLDTGVVKKILEPGGTVTAAQRKEFFDKVMAEGDPDVKKDLSTGPLEELAKHLATEIKNNP